MNAKSGQRWSNGPWALIALFALRGVAFAKDGADAGPDGGVAGDALADLSEMAALQARMRLLEERMIEDKAIADMERKEAAKTKEKVKGLSEAIQFSGFFDMSVSTYKNNPNVFALGTFEFDLKKEFNKYFQVGAALVFANSQADLAVGFIDLHLFGGLIPARGNIFLESGFHLQVGRFDIPLGNDWLYFASLDRPTMSAPLTTAVLMDGGYNDVGFRVVGNYKFVNYAGYVLEGVGQGVAVGGRLAFIPFNNPFTFKIMDAQPLDVGVSYLRDYSQGGVVEQETYAVDMEARYELLRLQAEYYHRNDNLNQLHWRGYQGSLFGTFLDGGPLPVGVGVRFDQVENETMRTTESECLRRLTLAAFIRPFDVTVLKLEYLHHLQGNDDFHGDSVFAQLVIGFK